MYQVITVLATTEARQYIADTINGEEGYTVLRTARSFILKRNGKTVLIVKW